MDAKDQEIASLKAKIADQDKTIATQQQALVTKDTDLAEANAVITDLKLKLSEAETTVVTNKLPVIVVDKKNYELLSDFMWKGALVNLEALKTNKKLAAELVKEGVGNLRPLPDQE